MKNKRHAKILDIISQSDTVTQSALTQKLREFGFNVTQATVSRDIRSLAFVKVTAGDGYKYALPTNVVAHTTKHMTIFSQSVISVEYAPAHDYCQNAVRYGAGGGRGGRQLDWRADIRVNCGRRYDYYCDGVGGARKGTDADFKGYAGGRIAGAEASGMLTGLHIKNVAVIDETEIELGAGLNVLTGETGAGKSIVIGSVNMILGERGGKDWSAMGEKARWYRLYFPAVGAGVRACAGAGRGV